MTCTCLIVQHLVKIVLFVVGQIAGCGSDDGVARLNAGDLRRTTKSQKPSNQTQAKANLPTERCLL